MYTLFMRIHGTTIRAFWHFFCKFCCNEKTFSKNLSTRIILILDANSMMAAVTGHRHWMVRLVSVETAAKKECFQLSAEVQ